MNMIPVGHEAPGFRLPSAQGPDVALEDYRGRKNAIVWFTKGMGCVFCRQHMSQLARLAPELAKRNTEVLEITPTPLSRARSYAQKYNLPFPYLSDAGDHVRRAWHLDVRRRGPLWYAGGVLAGFTMQKPQTDFGQDPPAFGELPTVLRDEDMGFFIVDREGVVRYAYGGSYVTKDAGGISIRPIPSHAEILGELESCAAA